MEHILKIAESKTLCPCCRVNRIAQMMEIRASKSVALTALGEASLKLFHYCLKCDGIYVFKYYDYRNVINLLKGIKK